MYASSYGDIPVIELLLSRGADMKARDKNGYTAFGIAAYQIGKGLALFSSPEGRISWLRTTRRRL